MYHNGVAEKFFHDNFIVYSNYSQSINIHVHSGTGTRIHYSILIPVTYWYQDPIYSILIPVTHWYQDPLQYPHSWYLLVPGSITASSSLVPGLLICIRKLA